MANQIHIEDNGDGTTTARVVLEEMNINQTMVYEASFNDLVAAMMGSMFASQEMLEQIDAVNAKTVYIPNEPST